MKYKVYLLRDKTRDRNYYDSHCEITKDYNINDIRHFIISESIPPYNDINANKACYIDSKRCKWIFDEDKYLEIIGVYSNDKPIQDIHSDIIVTMNKLDNTLLSLSQGVEMLNKAIEIYRSNK